MKLYEIDYCTDFLCTYQLYQDEENIENEYVQEQQEDMYRIQYLQAFQLKHWDDDTISNTMDKLYNILKDTKLISFIEKIPQTNHSLFYLFTYRDNNKEYLSEKDKRILFNFLFQFDFFYLTHICIYQYINNGYIEEKSLNELEKAIDHKINLNK